MHLIIEFYIYENSKYDLNSKITNKFSVIQSIYDSTDEIDNKYFRPTEVNSLKGDFSLAKKELGWVPKIHIKTLIKEMVTDELKDIYND